MLSWQKLKMKPSSQLVAKYPKPSWKSSNKDSGIRYRLEGYLFPTAYTVKTAPQLKAIDDMLAAMDRPCAVSRYDQRKESDGLMNCSAVLLLLSKKKKG